MFDPLFIIIYQKKKSYVNKELEFDFFKKGDIILLIVPQKKFWAKN